MWKALVAILGAVASLIAIYQFVSGNAAMPGLRPAQHVEIKTAPQPVRAPVRENDLSRFTPLLRDQASSSDVLKIIAYEGTSPAYLTLLNCPDGCSSERLVKLAADYRLIDTVALDRAGGKFAAIGRDGNGLVFDLARKSFTPFKFTLPCAENGAAPGRRYGGPTKVNGGKFIIQNAQFSDNKLTITAVAANCGGDVQIGTKQIPLRTANVFLASFWQLRITINFDRAGLIADGAVETLQSKNDSLIPPRWFLDAAHWPG